MISVLVMSHGGLAEELVAAARHIVGEVEGVEALCLGWDESADRALSRATELLNQTLGRPDCEGVLILVDIHGGTPSNVACRLVRDGVVEVVAGVNLAMMVRLACPGGRAKPLAELATWIAEKGKGSVCQPSAAAHVGRTSDG